VVDLAPYVAEIIGHCSGAGWDRVDIVALASQCRHVQSNATEISHSKALYFFRLAANSHADVLAVCFEANAVVYQWCEG
jgi:hypothetical protein